MGRLGAVAPLICALAPSQDEQQTATVQLDITMAELAGEEEAGATLRARTSDLLRSVEMLEQQTLDLRRQLAETRTSDSRWRV